MKKSRTKMRCPSKVGDVVVVLSNTLGGGGIVWRDPPPGRAPTCRGAPTHMDGWIKAAGSGGYLPEPAYTKVKGRGFALTFADVYACSRSDRLKTCGLRLEYDVIGFGIFGSS